MGYYSTLTHWEEVKVDAREFTGVQFMEQWEKAVKESKDPGYLDFYKWSLNEGDPDYLWFDLEVEDDEWYAKHYADRELAEFISRVIAKGASSVLEFVGEDNCQWGYYISRDSVKNIEYVKMVDGKPIDV
jgi:hypothetical protein